MGERDTRQRMLQATARLVASHGYHGTSLRGILEESEAPRGSLYFHFPGGKDQLVQEAVQHDIDWTTDALQRAFGKHAPARAVRTFFAEVADYVADADYGVGCPVASLVLDGLHGAPELHRMCHAALEAWYRIIHDALRAAGVPPKRADTLASFVLSAEEGAMLLCRARRSTAPLHEAAAEVARLLEAEPATRRQRTPAR